MRKAFSVVVACLFIMLLATMVDAKVLPKTDVTGKWYITGKLTVTAKAKGMKAVKFTDYVYDYLDLNADHTFLMEIADIDGTWSQAGKKWFTSAVNYPDVETFFEDYFASYGYDILCTVTTCAVSGTGGKGTIKGTVTIKGSFTDFDYGVSGFATAKYTFTGVPAVAALSGAQAPQGPTKTLKEGIKEALDKTLFPIISP